MMAFRSVPICVLVVLACTSCALGYKALRCTVCKATRHLAQCDDVQMCDATTHVCFVEKVVNGDGVTHVNAGCREKSACNSKGCYGEAEADKRSVNIRSRRAATAGQNEAVLCHHCCDTDFCNMYGCKDTHDVISLPGRRCFSCEKTQAPELCHKTVNCAEDEVCKIEQLAFGDERWYRSGCIKEGICSMLKNIRYAQSGRRKRSGTPIWSDCCENHMCNGHINVAKAPPSPESVSYQCPAFEPPPPVQLQTSKPGGDSGSKCYSCPNVGFPKDCTATEHCTFDEVCYTKMLSSSDESIYEMGCMKKKMCDMLHIEHIVHNRRKRSQSHSVLWAECCKEDLCNRYLVPKDFTPFVPSGGNGKGSCKDINTACSLYDRAFICTGSNEKWARVKCRAYCKFCTADTPTTVKPMGPECVDKNKNCLMYDPAYICEGQNEAYARVHCQARCGYCNDYTTINKPKEPTCTDMNSNCFMYDPVFICKGEYEAYAKVHCRAHCGYCNVTTVLTTLITPSLSTLLPTTPPSTTVGRHSTSPTTSTSTTTTQPTTTPTTSPHRCFDLDDDCDSYGHNYICTTDYFPWSQIHCAKYCGICTDATTSTTTTTPRPTTSTPPPLTECKDVDNDCDTYGREYICTPEYHDWSRLHCAKFCGICVDPSAVTTPTTTPKPGTTVPHNGCYDVEPDCATYGFDYICAKDYEPWSLLHCKKFCNLCDRTPPTTPVVTSPPCVDLEKDCAAYGYDYICSKDYAPWSKIHCAKFCGHCQVATKSTPPPVANTTPALSVNNSQGPCIDEAVDCHTYGRDYICAKDYEPWAKLHCAKFCGYCKVVTTTVKVCVDTDADCHTYGRTYICAKDYEPWARQHCPKYCNLC